VKNQVIKQDSLQTYSVTLFCSFLSFRRAHANFLLRGTFYNTQLLAWRESGETTWHSERF